MYPSWKLQEPVKNKHCSWLKSIIILVLFFRKSANSTKERSIRHKSKLKKKIALPFNSKTSNCHHNLLHKNRRRLLDLLSASETSNLQNLLLINPKNIPRLMCLACRSQCLKNVWCKLFTKKYSKIHPPKWTTSKFFTSKRSRKT